MTEFKIETIQTHTQITSSYFPNSRLFFAKNYQDSDLYKLLKGISKSFKDIDDLFTKDFKNLSILDCDDEEFLSLWESSVGIPDNIFKKTTELTFEERRNQVLTKLRSLGVLTIDDMRALANLLGLNVTIQKGLNAIYPPYTPPFIPLSEDGVRFVLMIKSNDFDASAYPPYTPPFIPKGTNDLLINLFEAVKPANVKLIFT